MKYHAFICGRKLPHLALQFTAVVSASSRIARRHSVPYGVILAQLNTRDELSTTYLVEELFVCVPEAFGIDELRRVQHLHELSVLTKIWMTLEDGGKYNILSVLYGGLDLDNTLRVQCTVGTF